jgi:hypothetical protein
MKVTPKSKPVADPVRCFGTIDKITGRKLYFFRKKIFAHNYLTLTRTSAPLTAAAGRGRIPSWEQARGTRPGFMKEPGKDDLTAEQ